MSDAGDPKRAASRGPAAGLVIQPGKAKYQRPAPGLSGNTSQVKPGGAPMPPLVIDTHAALAAKQRMLAGRVAANPDLAVMLLINPVLAFKAMGVELAPDIASHVLHAIQHPPEVRSRREELEASLKEALGEVAQPTDAVWNARLLFTLRKLKPLVIGEAKPVYTPPLGQEESKGLNTLRPAGVLRYPQPRLLPPRSSVGSVAWKESLRRMDLDAPAPQLPVADSAPAEVPLEDLWFYKDQDAVVHDALELGLIMKRSFPIHSPDSFRQVLSGEKPNAFRRWIKSLRFNPA